MLRMHVPLDVFWMLKGIASTHGIKNTDWSKKSFPKVSVIRISEFTRLYRIQMHVEDPPKREIKRAFTIEVAHSLYQSLIKIIGEDEMRKTIKEHLDKETDPYKKLLLMAVIKYENGDTEFIKKAADYVEMLYRASESK